VDGESLDHLQCLPGTRSVLIDETVASLVADGTGPRLLMLLGVAGAGKTTMAQTVAHRLTARGIPNYHFLFNPNSLRTNGPVLKGLIIQLSALSATIGDTITQKLVQYPFLGSAPLSLQFNELVLEPATLHPPSQPFCVILDGFSDIMEDELRSDVLYVLENGVPKLPPSFRFLITSRPRFELSSFETKPHFTSATIDITSSANLEDVTAYVNYRLLDISRLRSSSGGFSLDASLTAGLVEAAGGLFMWAKVVCDYLALDPPSAEHRLRDLISTERDRSVALPPELSMDKWYGTILERLDWKYDSDLSTLYHPLIGALLVAKAPLISKTLQLFYTEELDGLPVSAALQFFGDIVNGQFKESNEGYQYEILHHSFYDFVTNPSRCSLTYHIDTEKQHRLLAQRCLRALNQGLTSGFAGMGFSGSGTVDAETLKQRLLDVLDLFNTDSILNIGRPATQKPYSGHSLVPDTADQIEPHLKYAGLYTVYHLSCSQKRCDAAFQAEEFGNLMEGAQIRAWAELIVIVGGPVDFVRRTRSLLAALLHDSPTHHPLPTLNRAGTRGTGLGEGPSTDTDFSKLTTPALTTDWSTNLQSLHSVTPMEDVFHHPISAQALREAGFDRFTTSSPPRKNAGGSRLPTLRSPSKYTSTFQSMSEGRSELSHERIERILGPYVVKEARLENFHRGCYPGTRMELLGQISRWIEGVSSLTDTDLPAFHQCICISGRPGSGKSTIASSIISELLEQISLSCPGFLSAHFCVRRLSATTTDPTKIFTTIAHELALNSHFIAHKVNRMLTPAFAAGITSEEEQRRLLLEPIQAYAGIVLVVIDALDELSDPSSFASILARTIPNLPKNMRLILTARNEHGILRSIGKGLVSQVKLDIATDRSFNEVRFYMESRFEAEITPYFEDEDDSVAWPSKEKLDELAGMADGLYVWARTAVDYILSWIKIHGVAKRDTMLGKLTKGGLKDVNNLYLFILRQAQGEDDYGMDPHRSNSIKRVLGFIVILKDPRELSLIEDFLRYGLDSQEFDIRRFVERARSVMIPGTVPITGSIVPQMHKSFVDFITSDRAAEFQIIVDEHQGYAVECAFKCMTLRLHFNMFNLGSSFVTNKEVENLEDRISALPPGLVYASEFWGDHLEEANPEYSLPIHLVQILLQDQLLFWLEIMSVRGEAGHAVESMSALRDWLQRQMSRATMQGRSGSKVDMNDFAADAARLIKTFEDCIDSSVPHIYISLLAFSPEDSVVSRHYRAEAVTPVIPSPSGILDWDSWEAMTNDGMIFSISFSPCGHRIAAGYLNGTVRVWDVETGECVLGPLKGHEGYILSVCFSPNGRFIASGSWDETIRVWDSNTGECILGPLWGHRYPVRSVSFSPNSELIASGSNDRTIRIWDTRTGECVLGPLEGHTGWVLSVSSSPDGLYIASGSEDQTIRLWDAKTGRCILGPLQGHTSGINSISFSPDGRRFASGSDDKTLRIWDAQAGSCICGPLTGHTNEVFTVSYSTDGQYIASGSSDQTILIWDAHTGVCIAGPIGGHVGSVSSVSFSPDGSHLASGSWDGTIRLWDVDALLSYTRCEPGDDTNISHRRLTDQTIVDEKGWFLGPKGHSLFWAPKPYEAVIWRPSTVRIIGCPAMIKPDLSNLVTGKEWLDCFPKVAGHS
jgi:WD40 repeat protein